MQLEFVVLLQPRLAEMLGAAIVRVLFCFLDLFQVAIVDAAYVAEHVRGKGPARVLTEQARLDVDAGEAVAVGDEFGHLLVRQAGADRQRLEIAAFFEQLLEALSVLGLDVDDAGQAVDQLVQVATLGGRDFQRVGGVVARQHKSVAIKDQAPVGHDGHQ